MRESKKSEGGAFKAPPPPGSYRVKDIKKFFKWTVPVQRKKGKIKNIDWNKSEN